MDNQQHTELFKTWNQFTVNVFRFICIFLTVFLLPVDRSFFHHLVELTSSGLSYEVLFNLSVFRPYFFEGSIINDFILLTIFSLVGACIWDLFEKGFRKDYDKLYQWLRIALRYRLAIAVFALGIVKLFPLLVPYPSLTHLNTPYGDFDNWKIFNLSLGIVPSYQSFLGIADVLASILLLYHKTAFIGAFIIMAFTGNLVLSNLAYEGGDIGFNIYVLTIASFLFLHDLPRLASLLFYEKPTNPPVRQIHFSSKIKRFRLALKSSLSIFLIGFAVLVYGTYKEGRGLYPGKPPIEGISGFYNVNTFVINNDTVPQKLTSSVRWKNIVFEEWATLSIAYDSPSKKYISEASFFPLHENERLFEVEGIVNRQFYTYTFDNENQLLRLTNLNPELNKEGLALKLTDEGNGKIILSGKNDRQDSIYAELQKVDKKYLLKEVEKHGRRSPLKI